MEGSERWPDLEEQFDRLSRDAPELEVWESEPQGRSRNLENSFRRPSGPWPSAATGYRTRAQRR